MDLVGDIKSDHGYYIGKPIPFPFPPGLYDPATSKARVFGFDGALHYVTEGGPSYTMPCPAIHPFDDVQREWPTTALYFVEMLSTQYAVIAKTMREACSEIEKAEGWA